MTPKEKAKDLVDRYYWTFGDGYLGDQHIQCALIAVDMLMEEFGTYYIINSGGKNEIYWEEVKKEIELL